MKIYRRIALQRKPGSISGLFDTYLERTVKQE